MFTQFNSINISPEVRQALLWRCQQQDSFRKFKYFFIPGTPSVGLGSISRTHSENSNIFLSQVRQASVWGASAGLIQKIQIFFYPRYAKRRFGEHQQDVAKQVDNMLVHGMNKDELIGVLENIFTNFDKDG
jgi:hypothetical protein